MKYYNPTVSQDTFLDCLPPFPPHWGAHELQISSCSSSITATVLISHKIERLCTLDVFKMDISIISPEGASLLVRPTNTPC